MKNTASSIFVSISLFGCHLLVFAKLHPQSRPVMDCFDSQYTMHVNHTTLCYLSSLFLPRAINRKNAEEEIKAFSFFFFFSQKSQ